MQRNQPHVKSYLINKFSLFAWLPLFAIPIGVYCDLKANNKLTQSQFDWKKAIIVAVVQFSIAIVFFKLKNE